MALDPHLFTQTQLSLLSTERISDLLQSTSLISSIPPAVLAKQHGLAILNLSIISQRTGLGGKIILELEKDAAAGGPGRGGKGGEGGGHEHTLRTGDMVRVEEMPASGSAKKREKVELGKKGVQGVVVRVDGGRVVVAVENTRGKLGGSEDDGNEGGVDGLLQVSSGRLWVFKVANDTTYVRMEKAMSTLQNLHEKSSLSHLHRVLLAIDTPLPVSQFDEQKAVESFFDENLNPSQKSAVRFALASPDIALIHGPPGTGKTQTLIEVLQQLVRIQGKRVLVCGPSNISVDNILLRLPPDIPAVRVGHPARLLPGVVARSLDVLVRTSEAAEIVGDVRKELDEKMKAMAGTGKNRLRGSERREGWREVRELRGEYRRREEGAVRGLVRGSKVVVATLHGASDGGGRWLRGERFDVVVIDEGSQALEAQTWGAILHGSEMGNAVGKVIIAGDHMQLPPTVKSENEKPKVDGKGDSGQQPPSLTREIPLPKPGAELRKLNIPTSLSLPMFTRLLNSHGEKIKRLLTTQYRMHETIMTFPSKAFYGGKLIAHDSVRGRLLQDLPGVEDTEDTHYPIIFLDTQGGDFPESEADAKSPGIGTESKSNPGEILLCVSHVRKLLVAGVKGSSIAVITPYSAQLSLLVDAFSLAAGSSSGEEAMEWGKVELSSIDGFQGREKDVVVISLVRSNDAGEIGFLREGRRMNVAVTRPKRCLVVVGDGETLRGRGGGGDKAGTKKPTGERETGIEMEEEFVWRWIGWLEEAEAEVGVDVRYPSLQEAVSEAAELGIR
ncbi:P-loop containing nucleoside triphosphate hydrolase protein [Tirmania nivea]|nr:P-loop containing nucleoside triphosphate hydrolase protein [Tirmania nivea]